MSDMGSAGLHLAAQRTTYHVTVYTGDLFGAGTDADVFLQMFGETEDSGIYIICVCVCLCVCFCAFVYVWYVFVCVCVVLQGFYKVFTRFKIIFKQNTHLPKCGLTFYSDANHYILRRSTYTQNLR